MGARERSDMRERERGAGTQTLIVFSFTRWFRSSAEESAFDSFAWLWERLQGQDDLT